MKLGDKHDRHLGCKVSKVHQRLQVHPLFKGAQDLNGETSGPVFKGRRLHVQKRLKEVIEIGKPDIDVYIRHIDGSKLVSQRLAHMSQVEELAVMRHKDGGAEHLAR